MLRWQIRYFMGWQNQGEGDGGARGYGEKGEGEEGGKIKMVLLGQGKQREKEKREREIGEERVGVGYRGELLQHIHFDGEFFFMVTSFSKSLSLFLYILPSYLTLLLISPSPFPKLYMILQQQDIEHFFALFYRVSIIKNVNLQKVNKNKLFHLATCLIIDLKLFIVEIFVFEKFSLFLKGQKSRIFFYASQKC